MNSWFKRVQSSKQEPAVKEEGATQEAEGGPPQGASIRPGIGGGGGIGGFFANVATKIITTLAEEKERFMQETDHDDDEGNHLQGKDEHVTPLWLALAYHVDVEVGGGSDGAGDLSVIGIYPLPLASSQLANFTQSLNQFTPHSTLHTPHSTLHTPHSTLHTPHSTSRVSNPSKLLTLLYSSPLSLSFFFFSFYLLLFPFFFFLFSFPFFLFSFFISLFSFLLYNRGSKERHIEPHKKQAQFSKCST